jgi:hypothetical protein
MARQEECVSIRLARNTRSSPRRRIRRVRSEDEVRQPVELLRQRAVVEREEFRGDHKSRSE